MPAEPWEIHNAEFVTGAVAPAGFPELRLPQIAFAGRSNVGKSSLLNMLVRQKSLARTSNSPGLTQQINFFLINQSFYFVDLPGYGYAKVPPAVHKTWQKMMERYFIGNGDLRLLIFLLDARRTPSAQDDLLLEFLNHHGIPTLPVLTKADKLNRNELTKARKSIADHYHINDPALPVTTSTLRKIGRESLLQIIHGSLQDPQAAEMP